jgi:hypothetical protein
MAITRNMDELLAELYRRKVKGPGGMSLRADLLAEATRAGWVVKGPRPRLTKRGLALASVVVNRVAAAKEAF